MIQEFTTVDDLPLPIPWTVHGSKPIYDSRWVSLDLVDVEPTAAERYEHHVVTVPYEAVCVLVHHPEKGVLLLYRHRFITNTAGFELPAGGVEPGEDVLVAASREVLEETGCVVDRLEKVATGNASDGVSTQRFHFVYARASNEESVPADAFESDRLYWVPVDSIASLVQAGLVPGCPAMFGLLFGLQFGYFGSNRPAP